MLIEYDEQNQPSSLLQYSYIHSNGFLGQGITIAILDTGIYPHPDIKNQIYHFKDFINHKTSAYDDNGHGTHIAGILSSRGQFRSGNFVGIAPFSRLFVVKVLDQAGNGQIGTLLKGIQYILAHQASHNIRVVNISIGSTDQDKVKKSILLPAVEAMWDSGIAVCASAGNEGPGRKTITVPGCCKKIITVGSLPPPHKGNASVSDFSSKGPTKECICKPEVLAPGYQILSCANAGSAYTLKSGTSMATPIVSGATALLFQKNPDYTSMDAKIKLYTSTTDLGLPKEKQGWGVINLPALLS